MVADYATVEGAIRILLDERVEFKRLEARQNAARETLRRYFREHPESTEYVCETGVASYEKSTQRRLDTDRVRAELGARAALLEYEAPVETVRVRANLSPEMRGSIERALVERGAAASAAEQP